MPEAPDSSHSIAGAAGRWLPLLLAIVIAVPGIALGAGELLHVGVPELAPWVLATLFGLAVVGAAFVLAWAAEAAQLDVSASLAIGVLALIAVLPEYAVGFVFAWKGGKDVQRYGPDCLAPGGGESNCSLVLANMTGANRLLIGIGWAMVVFIAWWRVRGRRRFSRDAHVDPRASGRYGIRLSRSRAVELSYLALATAYCLSLPLKRTVTLLDAVVLVGIFVAYTLRISKAPASDPELIGPSAALGGLSRRWRRASVAALFVFAAAAILLVAEHFAESLVATGAELGVSDFFLVQWLAPVASEAPELLVAGLYAWRLKTGDALTTLVSSKVNQWTLLVGTLPVVFAAASGSFHGLPIAPAQREELLLTAAQTVFALAILSDLSISVREAAALFALFAAQFPLRAVLPEPAHGTELLAVSAMYLLFGAVLIVRHRTQLLKRIRDGFRAPYSELEPQEPETAAVRAPAR
ncbi:MAG TPA: sodium:proton exchanger [Actinomycetes bacterium]|nr:sodium:proton exchanger [Actinomycetes bacterium]